MRRAGRRDKTHATIRDGLREIGWHVIDTGDVGGGFPDLVVIAPGTTVFVECKSRKGALRESQGDLRMECFYRNAPYVVARTLDDAIYGVTEAVAG